MMLTLDLASLRCSSVLQRAATAQQTLHRFKAADLLVMPAFDAVDGSSTGA
jgi:hypothetical protein